MGKAFFGEPWICSGRRPKAANNACGAFAAVAFLFLALLVSSASAQNIDDIRIASNSGRYKAGEEILILVGFSEEVDVDTSNGSPTVRLEIGSSTKQTQWVEQPVSTHLFFRYIVQQGDIDTDGVRIPANPLDLNRATIRKSGTMVNANLDHAPVHHTNILVFAPTDRHVLEIFYDATGGDGWTNSAGWNGGMIPNTLNSLHGVTPSRGIIVVGLNLANNNLSGEIPPELRHLPKLTLLNLTDNNLSGTIPPELGDMTNLESLFLHHNQEAGMLMGEIPPELGNLLNLNTLNLSGNKLSGTIPVELGNLASLNVELALGDNMLTGEIPSELGKLTSLNSLILNNNELRGEIPPELGEITSLRLFYLNNNKLSGTVPVEFGKLTSLEYVYFQNNNLSGEIPPEFRNLTSLERLRLDGNNLSGEIPPELGEITSLNWLLLRNNELSGEIPSDLGELTSLSFLLLHGNMLRGEIPVELEKLTSLRWLYLNGNMLSGDIPAGLEKLTSLERLYLNNNMLSGDIPAGLEKLVSLQMLDLSGNPMLTGTLPESLMNSSLQTLNIRCTDISTPDTQEFNAWLARINFTKTEPDTECQAPPPPPGQVTGVVATGGVGQLTVSWEVVTGADGYKVEWKSDLEPSYDGSRQRTITDGVTTSYTIPNLVGGTEYTVRVIASNSSGDGPPSSEETGTPTTGTSPPPPPPRVETPDVPDTELPMEPMEPMEPVDMEPMEPMEPVDMEPMEPMEPPLISPEEPSGGGGGCALASDRRAVDMLGSGLLNLFLIVSSLVAILRRSGSKTR